MTRTICSRQIHLWHIDLTRAIDTHLLSEAERTQYQQIKSTLRQREYAHCRSALRQILAQYLDCAPQAITYTHNDFGKPDIEGPIYFNLSHTKDNAVIAIGTGHIGIDIESQQRRVADIAAITERFFHPAETQWILSQPAAHQTNCFLQCWTAKEAIVKAIGSGLSEQLHAFSVAQQNQVAVSNGETWHLYPFTKQALCGCIAYAQANCQIIEHEFL